MLHHKLSLEETFCSRRNKGKYIIRSRIKCYEKAVISSSLFAVFLSFVLCPDLTSPQGSFIFIKFLLWSLWFVLKYLLFSFMSSPRGCQQWRTALNRGWSWKALTRSIRPCTSSSLWPRWARRALTWSMDLNGQADYFGLKIAVHSQTALHAGGQPSVASLLLFL